MQLSNLIFELKADHVILLIYLIAMQNFQLFKSSEMNFFRNAYETFVVAYPLY